MEPFFPLENNAVSAHVLVQKVEEAKENSRALNDLVRAYTPFIKKCAAHVFFKDEAKEDCLTEAMLAFAWAVKTYRIESGNFIAYARAVITNRLIDIARSENARTGRIVRKKSDGEDGADDGLYENAALAAFYRQEDEKNLALEIEAASKDFAAFGFDWNILQKKCPKQKRSRDLCQTIARTVLRSERLLRPLLENHTLPISALSQFFPKKSLEKYRAYIIALVLLSRGEFPYINSFLPSRLYLEM